MTVLTLLLVAAFVLAVIGVFIDHRAPVACAVALVVVYLLLTSHGR